MSDRVSHRAVSARRAALSNVGSPVRRLSAANSRMKVPTPAVQVTGVSLGLTPLSRFTVPYGIPLGVSNAADSQVKGQQHLSHQRRKPGDTA